MSTTPATSAPGSPRRRAPDSRATAPRERLRRAVSNGSPTTAARLVDARCAAATHDSLTLYAQLAALQRTLADASASVYEEHVRHAQLMQEAALRTRPHRHSLPPCPSDATLATAAAKCAVQRALDNDVDDDAADWITATTSSGGSSQGARDDEDDPMDLVVGENADENTLCTLCVARAPTTVTHCCAHAACTPCFSHVARCPWCRATPLTLQPLDRGQ